MTSAVGRSLIDAVRALAAAASERILAIYESPFAVTRKADDSPLTEADMASHRTIVTGLLELTPELPVLSEESDDVDFATRSGWNRYWLVDPLDGTKDFVKRNGEFTVNIALIEHNAPVLGVVAAPVRGVAYAGARGAGAFRFDRNGATRLAVRRPAPTTLRVAASRSHSDPRTLAFIAGLGDPDRVAIGSSLKFCLLAEGTIDVYPRFGPTSEWDTAAGQCVVEAAGGKVTGLDLAPLRYNTKESLINPYFLAFGDEAVDWGRHLAAAKEACT